MKIVILTQNDPFYLQHSFDYLLKKLPHYAKVVGCVVLEAAPFGNNQSTLQKIINTYKIFGLRFFLYYGIKLLRNKYLYQSSLGKILRKYNVPIIEIKGDINNEENLRTIQALQPDLFISIASNQIFKKNLIELAPKGCINLHTSLLPQYRGPMPCFWVLMYDEEYTGVSVFFVNSGIDSGPILVQKKIKINNMTHEELIWHSKRIGMDAIIEAVQKIHDGNYNLIPNSDENMSYFSFPTRREVKAFYKLGKKFF